MTDTSDIVQSAGGAAATAQQPGADGSHPSRREMIMKGQAEPELLQTKSPRLSGSLGSLIKRTVKRTFDHRCEPRYRAAIAQGPESLELNGVEMRICDISASGLSASGRYEPTIGEAVSIRIEHCDDLTAKVVWSKGETLGVKLPDNSIHLTILD